MAGTRGWRRADGGRRPAGGQRAAAPPPAGGSHPEGGTPPTGKEAHPPPTGKEAHPGLSGGRDPAANALEPAIRRPLASGRAPRQGHRRRGGDSPRAGGSPRRRPRAARRWRPDPWRRPGGGARVPYSRAHPAAQPGATSAHSPSRRSIAGALSRGRLPLPPLTLTLLATGPYLRFQGRAPPASGRERRAQDPGSGIQLRSARPDPDSEPRAPGDEQR